MLSRRTLSNEHAELEELATGIAALCLADPPDIAALTSLRWRLHRVLTLHLAKEDKLLYPALARSASPSTQEVARRFIDDWGGQADRFQRWMTDWPSDRIAREWPAFAAETRRLMDALSKRIVREEHILYPLIDGNR